MKNLMLVFAIALSTVCYAQTGDDYIEVARDVLNTEKKAAVAQAMQLTDDISTEFWALYNEYNAKLYTVHSKRVKIIKDYSDNYETLTGEKADELISASYAYQQEILNLQKSYYKKMKKALGPGIAAKYFQVEGKIETLIDAQLALDIPVLETH